MHRSLSEMWPRRARLLQGAVNDAALISLSLLWMASSEACRKAGADPEKVAKELDSVVGVPAQMSHDFNTWPTDLLSDYVLKVHHRGIRQVGPKTLDLLAKVVEVHGPNHPELHEIQSLFQQTMVDLTNHLMKEEMMLYPFIYQLCDGDLNHHSVQAFHCGSVESPIGVMEAEHEEEGQRQEKIRQLTNDYTPPADACGSLKLRRMPPHNSLAMTSTSTSILRTTSSSRGLSRSNPASLNADSF